MLHEFLYNFVRPAMYYFWVVCVGLFYLTALRMVGMIALHLISNTFNKVAEAGSRVEVKEESRALVNEDSIVY